VDLIGGWNSVLIRASGPGDSAVEGQRLGDLASARTADPYRLTIELLRRSEGQVAVGVCHERENVGPGPSAQRRLQRWCRGGGSSCRRGHPIRATWDPSRVLGCVRERRVMPLVEAIKVAAGGACPPRRSGRIAAVAADLVAFDPPRCPTGPPPTRSGIRQHPAGAGKRRGDPA
jgi:hypothetical protein